MKLLYIILILLQIGSFQPAMSPTYEFKSVNGLQYTEQNTEDSNPGGFRPSGPKKVSGLGWLDWYVWGQYNGVPVDASNEDMYVYYQYIRNGGTLSWSDWYYQQNNPLPIGDAPFLLLGVLCTAYIVFKRK